MQVNYLAQMWFRAVAPSLPFVCLLFPQLASPYLACFFLSPLLTKICPLLHPSSSTFLFLSLYLLFLMFFYIFSDMNLDVIQGWEDICKRGDCEWWEMRMSGICHLSDYSLPRIGAI